MSTAPSSSPHILVLPYPAQGHMLPLLELTHHLALRGLTITVVVTPRNLPLLAPLLSSTSSLPNPIQSLVLPFPPHPSLPSGVEHVSQLGHPSNYPIIAALSALAHPISLWFSSHPSPPLAILSDFFLGWTVSLAARLSLPRIAFFSSGPFFAAINDILWRRHTHTPPPLLLSFPDLPGSPSFSRHHLPSSFRNYVHSDPDSEIVRSSMIANASSWGCVFNTFHAIEGAYLEHLKRAPFGQGRVYAVGPLSLLLNPTKNRPDSTIMMWLDGCPEESVLYACFGSQKLLNQAQMEALASGLERSGIRFIWVVKKPGTSEQIRDGYGRVPEGFEERVEGRGLVIKGWAPQVEILGHRAVGGFLSHCGWNSILEAMAGGVMIIGWPMEAEQFVNARLLVEEMGAAVRVCEGADAVPDSVELGRCFAESMSIAEEFTQRGRAKKLRMEALAAVDSGGTSLRDLNSLVRDLNQLLHCQSR